MGKTSLSQHITMRWCQAKTGKHTILRQVAEELDAMRLFELVFLVRLREYQYSNLCYTDDMIYDMVSKKTSRSFQYSKEFLQKTMHNRECLIILDGLDEWTHPEVCPRTPRVPHNNHPDSCTVLTTTRSWKLSTIELPPNHIDRNVEISELILPTSNELKMKAFKVYHGKANNEDLQNIDISDFDKEVAKVVIGDIISIPYILLQIFCIWLDGLSIGKSKCEVYSNITEVTIKRGLKKIGLQTISLLPIEHLAIPKCLDKNELCKRHLSLLFKLAELAFFTLFSVLKESKLLIDSEIVLTFLTEPEIDFCLKVGLLNKITDTCLVSNIRYKVFFQHKSLHEFYAAIHIASRWGNQILQQTIGSVCTSLTSILEMTDVFVFVCGMNPQVYDSIFLDLQNVVANDTVTCKYRSDCNLFMEERTMLSFQSMQLSCFRESLRNENINCAISLQDIFVCKDTTDDIKLAVLHNFNLSSTKSISVKIENIDNELCFLNLASRTSSLETLRLTELRGRSAEALPLILHEQAQTLKCLQLHNVLIDLDCTLISIVLLTSLQALYFEHVTMTHNAIEMFFSFVRNQKIMRQLKLCSFICGHHYFRCNRSVLNLSQLNKLEKLYLHQVHVEELRVNTESLYDCMISGLYMTTNVESSLCENLLVAPVLSSLHLSDIEVSQQITHTIPKLTYLKTFSLMNIDMKERKLCFSREMTRLEDVSLTWVTMTYSAWKELFLSVSMLPHPVRLTIWDCKLLSLEEWQAIANEIEKTRTVELIEDLSFRDNFRAKFTLKFKND